MVYVVKSSIKHAVNLQHWKKTKAAVKWLDTELKIALAEQAADEGGGNMFQKPMELICGLLEGKSFDPGSLEARLIQGWVENRQQLLQPVFWIFFSF
jgi:hypothetical protein